MANDKLVAFAMGMHTRLGGGVDFPAGGSCWFYRMDHEIFRLICMHYMLDGCTEAPEWLRRELEPMRAAAHPAMTLCKTGKYERVTGWYF